MVETPQEAQALSDIGETPAAERPRGVAGLLVTVSFVIGSAALLIAMAADSIAVVGRHIGLPFLGSIEIVQTCIVIAASSAMVGATLGRKHAEVHILTERLSPRARSLLRRVANALGVVFFGCLLTGSVILVHDLWGGHERTELLHLPLTPLRMFWCASVLLILVLCLIRALGPDAEDAHGA